MRFIMISLMLVSGYANAHQWLPTYPNLTPSYVPGILQARMELFNRRNDIDYYEISVYDKDWLPVKFATTSKIIEVGFLKRKTVDVFIREEDRDKAVYICSKSKILAGGGPATLVSSRICSKIK